MQGSRELLDGTPSPKAVVVYDASDAGVCARTMALVGRLNLEARQRPGFWAFHELEKDAAANEKAAAQAAGAKWVIFVAPAGGELPPRVLKWIEGWLPL